MNKNKFDICIVGAGIIGLSVAYKLSQYYKNIIVIEKESSFGQHISSRNSEVIHSGFYYPENSLKAMLSVKGNRMLYDFAEKYSINYKKCGKLIVANNSKEINYLADIRANAISNNVCCEIISSDESKEIEPKVKALQSLWVPSTGIIDTHALMSKLEFLSKKNNVSFLYNHSVNEIELDCNYNLKVNDDCLEADIVINCAGLWAHKVSEMIGLKNYDVEYYKGDYYKCTTLRNLNCLIYPTPTIASLGLHSVLNLNGEVSFGPNIYKVNKVDYKINNKYHDQYVEEINKFININKDDIYCDFSGIRPKIKFNNNFNDFVIKDETNSGFKSFINLIGIDSPGVTSCLAIADYIKENLL